MSIPALARLLWRSNTRSGYRVQCSTASTRLSRIEVSRVDYEKLSKDRLGESSAEIRQRVETARQVQRERIAESSPSAACYADMRIAEVRKFCKPDETSESLMRSATSCCA